MLPKARMHLSSLYTPFGVRSVQDAVSYCNRCGMCASACPSYQQTKQEPFSPRGRNQALRLALSGKIKLKNERKLVTDMVRSCTLCGRCVQHCPGKIPTPELVLEMRRRQNIKLLPHALFYLLRLRQVTPRLFSTGMKMIHVLRWTGILHVLSIFPGCTWIGQVLKIWPHSAHVSCAVKTSSPTLIYLPSFEAEYWMPDLFEKTYRLAAQKHQVCVWQNTASGLFEYVYGDLRRSRKILQQLMAKQAALKHGTLPVLTDSIEVYYFLKQAPQLFAGFKTLEKKAINFAEHIYYVTDLLPSKLVAHKKFSSPVQLLSGAAFSQQTDPQLKAQQILSTLFKKNFVQCGYRDGAVPPLGYGFVDRSLSSVYMQSVVQLIAAHKTQSVFVLSGLAALELTYYTRKLDPKVHVRHIVELNG